MSMQYMKQSTKIGNIQENNNKRLSWTAPCFLSRKLDIQCHELELLDYRM